MKRWVAAILTVLFLATATLHVFAHHSNGADACKVCQVQASSAPAISSPRIVVVRTMELLSPRVIVPVPAALRVAAIPARAPPVLPS